MGKAKHSILVCPKELVRKRSEVIDGIGLSRRFSSRLRIRLCIIALVWISNLMMNLC